MSALTQHDSELADDACEALGSLLSFTASQFNIGKNLTDIQLALLASDMLERYWHWRFDEFAYVLREAVGGRWGTTYDRIDAPTVHGWCQKYEAERTALLEAEEERRHKIRRVEEQRKEALFPAELMPALYFRAKLEALPDGELRRGIAHYDEWPAEHPGKAAAQNKARTAREVLGLRLLWEVEEEARRATVEAQSEGYKAVLLEWVLGRERERQNDAATGALLAE